MAEPTRHGTSRRSVQQNAPGAGDHVSDSCGFSELGFGTFPDAK
ncbi:hypothetical protein [Streptomyces himalayensis]|nr:hypothetical protein [Streptomyces himalayensis]